MTVLLLETATSICSAALYREGGILAEETATAPHQHAALLNVFIEQLTSRAGILLSELDAIGLSEGPGSYTSLRVGAAMAKGLIFGLEQEVKLYPLSSLRALARAAADRADDHHILATQSSRRGEIYGLIRKAGSDLSSSQAVSLSIDGPELEALFGSDRAVACAGESSTLVADRWGRPRDRVMPGLQPHARLLAAELEAQLKAGAAAVDAATFEPRYLKPPFVTVSKKRKLL